MAQFVDAKNVKPCWYMRVLVSAMMDGQLTGMMLKYTEWHVAGCPQCQASLPFLETLHGRLFQLQRGGNSEIVPALTQDRLEGLQAKLDQVERGLGPSV